MSAYFSSAWGKESNSGFSLRDEWKTGLWDGDQTKISLRAKWREMTKMKPCLILLLLVFACRAEAWADDSHLYSTGRMMEIDRIASAWLIKRHADPLARFAFFEDGELITRGIAFDTPDARFCRTHNLSTFEILMAHFKISNPKLKALGKIIHEVEINFWAGKRNALVNDMTVKVNAVIRENPDPKQCLDAGFKIFDAFMEKLPKP